MAIRALPTLLLLFLLAAAASARPCKTLFYFSATTTTTYYPHHYLNRNPIPNFHLRGQNPRLLTLIFTTTTTATRFPTHRPSVVNFVPDHVLDEVSREESSSTMTSSDFPMKFYSSVSTSIRDRARDIMSVVGALLFGVGCGALTGAALYFLWALFFPRHFEFNDAASSSDDDEDYDDVAVAKKFGYVAIPAMPKMADDDIKKPALPAKEVV